MTSKLKCPWCGRDMMYSVLGQNLTSSHFCDNKDCNAFQMVLPDFLWEDIFAWKQSQKDLERARKAFEMIRDEFGIEDRLMTFAGQALTMKAIAEKALEQIEHKEK